MDERLQSHCSTPNCCRPTMLAFSELMEEGREGRQAHVELWIGRCWRFLFHETKWYSNFNKLSTKPFNHTRAWSIKTHVKSISRLCQKRYLNIWISLSSQTSKTRSQSQSWIYAQFSSLWDSKQHLLQNVQTDSFLGSTDIQTTAVNFKHYDSRRLDLHVEPEPVFTQSLKTMSALVQTTPFVQAECHEHHRHHENNTHWLHGGKSCLLIHNTE